MKSYYIRKSSRMAGPPYAGVTCQQAGVKPGRRYYRFNEAERDCRKLDACNPVGFVVEETGSGPDDDDLEATIIELTQEHGRHLFDVSLVAKAVGEASLTQVKQALYRLHERGRVCINPYPPEIAEADRITSCALDISVPC